MPTFQALQKCPHSTAMPTRFDVYRRESTRIREILLKFSPVIEPLSLDEAFIDLSDHPGDSQAYVRCYPAIDLQKDAPDRIRRNCPKQNAGKDRQRLEEAERPI